jgi:hypothetical protein
MLNQRRDVGAASAASFVSSRGCTCAGDDGPYGHEPWCGEPEPESVRCIVERPEIGDTQPATDDLEF